MGRSPFSPWGGQGVRGFAGVCAQHSGLVELAVLWGVVGTHTARVQLLPLPGG